MYIADEEELSTDNEPIYYIYGNKIAVQKETTPNYFPMRYKITAKEIHDAYPSGPDLKVKLFKSAEDAWKYCNSLDKRYTSRSATLYLRPVYSVSTNEILQDGWTNTPIQYEELQYTKKEHPTVKSMWNTHVIFHEETIETLDISLAILSPIKGEIRDSNDRIPITGNINFQTYNKSSCMLI